MNSELELDGILAVPTAHLAARTSTATEASVIDDVVVLPPPSAARAFAAVNDDLDLFGEESLSGHAATNVTGAATSAEVRAAPAQKSTADRYGLGVQLMRLSPGWLLAGGMAFVSLIVLCNWLIKPAAKAEENAPVRVAAATQAGSAAPSGPSSAPGVNETKIKPAPPVGGTAGLAPAAPQTQAAKAADAAPQAAPAPREADKAKPATAAPAQINAGPGGKITVQIGSFDNAAQAQERVNRLRAAGFDARVNSAELPGRGTWYRVQAGRFSDRSEAARYGAQMKSRGLADGVFVTESQE